MNDIVVILGSDALKRYSEKILRDGFLSNNWEAYIERPNINDISEDINLLIQIHGAPQSYEQDKEILVLINQLKSRNKILLLHRPDEIQIRLPELRNILLDQSETITLVFLGDKHINDTFFQIDGLRKEIIPHGFFDIKEPVQLDPIIIGSHTTWGEMRSINHLVKLLSATFKVNNSEKKVIGYIAGKPLEQVSVENVSEILKTMKIDEVRVISYEKYNSEKEKFNNSKENIIIVDNINPYPIDLGLTFNVQLYYLGNKIRTGESSGSAHLSFGVPVIFEMNGSEIIEDLHVIKVPYLDINNIESVGYVAGASAIVETLKEDKFVGMINHNKKQALKFNNSYVARKYINLF